MFAIQTALRIYLICLTVHDQVLVLTSYKSEPDGTAARFSPRVIMWMLLFCMPLEGGRAVCTVSRMAWIIWHAALVIECIVDETAKRRKWSLPKRTATELAACIMPQAITSIIVIGAVIYIGLCSA